ncbi:hypothetical protein [Vreelandella olivaria]|uniref:hypothetical protein n=1 Tax=Vreelandella olivaria TaxID=390919 RepID=UPI00201F90F5|nr:hypothetical protein [Halomonas olivaria]
MSNKTWLITGAARGLGAQIAQAALAAGDNDVGPFLFQHDFSTELRWATPKPATAGLSIT